MVVLGIETSCDETACAVVGPDGVRSDVVHTQVVHRAYGGVVPEIAGREHAERIVATAQAALDEAGVVRPDGVAATAGPGLIGAVLVGLSFGKALAAGWGVPFLGVNHLEGHLLSPLLEPDAPAFPFLALVVSGGHTTLYLAHDVGRYEVLAQTVDDAAGEAYDKVARLLGLGYPGGPLVDRLASTVSGSSLRFPRPLAGARDMSFSGLKTAVRQHVDSAAPAPLAEIAFAFQEAVVDVLCDRILRASAATGVDRVGLAGGVAANSRLRARVQELGLQVTLPPRSRCTDNGAMIAHAGRQHLLRGRRDALDLAARAVWSPEDLPWNTPPLS